MKTGLVLGLLGAAAGGGLLLVIASRRTQAGPTYAGNGLSDVGGYYDPFTGRFIEASDDGASPYGGLSPDAEAALIYDTHTTNEQWLQDQRDSMRRIEEENARTQEQLRFTDALNTSVLVGATAVWGVSKLPAAGRTLAAGLNAAAGLGRGLPAMARAAIVSPAAPILGGAVQGLRSIGQGIEDLQARQQGQGPYARLNEPGAITAATANVAAGTAVGAGSLGLASLDFNRGVHFLGLPVVTKGQGSRVRLFGFKELEF